MNALPEHLRTATAARTEQTAAKARTAIKQLTAAKRPISFVSVARAASISTDFLYKHDEFRALVERNRSKYGREQSSAAVRALARKLDEERAEHRKTIAEHRKALEVVQGENLALHRRPTVYEPQ